MKGSRVKYKNEKMFGGIFRSMFISKISDERKLNQPYDKASIAHQEKLIRHHKRIKPPVVEKLKNGTYRIVDGSHRLQALRNLRVRKVKVEVT